MSRPEEASPTRRPFAVPFILLLISVTHLAYVPLAELRQMPILPPALVLSVLLGAGYAYAARLARRGEGFEVAINLVVGEDLGVLVAGLILGHPWGEHLRPGTAVILVLQFALTFPEIWRRQESGRPIVAPARLAWFVLAYSLAFAAYIAFKPEGLWRVGAPGP
ncbi:MAG: hypothetical protein JSV86_03300 [Gemmatimonadota bacterium]|nr:MAG: hypothetical protein JSV86_03300 [Gemmatimonadota bacterium]